MAKLPPLSAENRERLITHGWVVGNAFQVVPFDRRSRVAQPEDKWFVVIYTNVPYPTLQGKLIANNTAVDFNAAVSGALDHEYTRRKMSGATGAMARLECEIDSLTEWLKYRRTGDDFDIPF